MLGRDRFAIEVLQGWYDNFVLAHRRMPKYWRLSLDSIGVVWYPEHEFSARDTEGWLQYHYALAVVQK